MCMSCPATAIPLFPYTTLFRSKADEVGRWRCRATTTRTRRNLDQAGARPSGTIRSPTPGGAPRCRPTLLRDGRQGFAVLRSEEHTSELQSPYELVCRLPLEKKNRSHPKIMTQMGNQGHARDGTRQIREWVEAGAIGTVREVHFWTNRPIWPQAIDRPPEAYHAPATLDWNLWLGPAPERPYHPAYAPFKW